MYRTNTMWIAALLLSGAAGGAALTYPFSSSQSVAEIEANEVDLTASEELLEGNEERGLSLIEDSSNLKRPDSNLPFKAIPFESLESGDRLLLGGNYVGAYHEYSKLTPNFQTQDGSLLIRLGLSAERAGFLDKSAKHYYDALESSSASTYHIFQGLLGTARVLELNEQYDDAIGLLCELYLVYGVNQSAEALSVPICSQLTNCLQKQYLAELVDNGGGLGLEFAWLETAMEPILQDDLSMPSIENGSNASASFKVIQNPNNDLTLALLDAELTRVPYSQLTSELGQQMSLDFSLSPDAHQAVSGRLLRISTRGMPVAILMDQVFGRQDLIWQQSSKQVLIRHRDEVTPTEFREFQAKRIRRLLDQMRFNFTDAQQRVSLLMNAANIAILEDDFADASTQFAAAEQLEPVQEIAAMLYFNMGYLDAAQQDRPSAFTHFYRAIDQTITARLQSKAYGMVASTELELGRPDKAVIASARSLHLNHSAEDQGPIALILAKAYLLDGNPMSASQALHKHESLIENEDMKRLATVLSTYARFKVSAPAVGLQDEGIRLVLALAALQPTDAKGFIDHTLLSRAFDAGGFRTRAIEHLAIAEEKSSGPRWPLQIQFELIEMHRRASEHQKAFAVLKKIAPQEDLVLETKRLLLDASLRLELDQPLECIETCQSLILATSDKEKQAEALNLMGKAYRGRGQHYAAALCFAGLMPDPETLEEPSLLPTTTQPQLSTPPEGTR